MIGLMSDHSFQFMMSQRSRRYASPATTAAYLGASLSTVNRLAKESVLHPTRIRRRVFFDLAEVDEVMAARRDDGKSCSGDSQVSASAERSNDQS
jgi:excisionase family DNA binding protein